MFETLQERLSGIFDRLTGRGSLSEADVDAAMREVRRALLEADVALEVVRAFTEQVRQRAIGQEVVRSITPGQMVVKIVHDELVDTLGREAVPLDLKARAAGAGADGRPAGLGQDHDHREDRPAAARSASARGC